MPDATVNVEETEHVDLKSLPGGFVLLRRLNYGEFLFRRQMMTKMKMTSTRQSRGMEGELEVANRKVTEYEFQKCIVDHNLENKDGSPIDFRQGDALDILDPRIGEEIATNIDRMNQFEEEMGNSPTGSEPQ